VAKILKTFDNSLKVKTLGGTGSARADNCFEI
jgi:hypothetical protein